MLKREITVLRKKALFNNKINWYIKIDGKDYGTIHGGDVRKIFLDEKRHSLIVYANDFKIGKVDEILIPEGNDNYVFHVSLSSSLIGNTFMGYIKIKQL